MHSLGPVYESAVHQVVTLLAIESFFRLEARVCVYSLTVSYSSYAIDVIFVLNVLCVGTYERSSEGMKVLGESAPNLIVALSSSHSCLVFLSIQFEINYLEAAIPDDSVVAVTAMEVRVEDAGIGFDVVIASASNKVLLLDARLSENRV